jgi:hypothetical protein
MTLMECVLTKIITRNNSFDDSVEYQVVSLFRYLKENGEFNDLLSIDHWLSEKSEFSIGSREKILEWANGVIEGKKFFFSERCEKDFTLNIARLIDECTRT